MQRAVAVLLALVAAVTAAASASAAKGPTEHQLALAGLNGRQLTKPECAPLTGPRWAYPVGPPIRGLPPPIADIQSDLYEVFAINTSCKTAAAWIRKFAKLHVPVKHNGNSTVLKGPKGWYCTAFPDKHGLAYAGGCQSKGGGGCVASNNYGKSYPLGQGCKITGGGKAFGWNWNVSNRRVAFGHDAKGVVHLFHVSGADSNLLFRYLNGKYQIQVLNTSGIGYLDSFTWRPSAGWKVKAIKSSSGAKCSVTKSGTIHCAGRVHPPSCLCTGDGGVVTITFTATPTKKKAGYLFGGAPWQFKITKMTPVPYLIPGTPDEAQKREGV